jgi:predicted amidohydrolase
MSTATTDSTIKIAVIQRPPVFLNLQQSLDRAGQLIDEATGQGAKVITFPETWLPGYPVWFDTAPHAALWDYPPAKALYRQLSENSVVIGDGSLEKLLTQAHRCDVVIVMGLNERLGGTLYNTIAILDGPNQKIVIHRKLVPTYTERLVWGRGDGSTMEVADTKYGRIGALVCWEHWMPLARSAMHAQHEAIHIAQWPTAHELHQIASRHYAFEGQCFVIASGCVMSRRDVIEGVQSVDGDTGEAMKLLTEIPGDDSDLLLRGGSSVIAPDGDFIVEPRFEDPSTVYAELDLGRITEGHLAMDTAGHYSRPDIFKLSINRDPQL